MKIKVPDNLLTLFNPFFSKIKNIDEKYRIYIFWGILLLIFLLDFFVLMSPQLDALGKINGKIKILSDDLKKTKEDMQKLDHYKSDVEQLKMKVSESHTRIKSKEEVPLVLERISYFANENSIRIDQIMPDTQNFELVMENNGRRFYSLPITIEAKGGYHHFGKFLNQIERQEIFLTVSSFTISATNDSRYNKINIVFKTVVYEEK